VETEWLLDLIAEGMQKLFCLGLERTPAAEVIPGTAQAWHEALTAGRKWSEARDTARIRAAFVTLAATRETWPAPRQFLDALPRVEQTAIGYEVKPATRAEAEAAIARCRRLLGDAPVFSPDAAKREPALSPAEKQRAEWELAQHYGTSGKVAAAGPDR
jgi:hypothetical protein